MEVQAGVCEEFEAGELLAASSAMTRSDNDGAVELTRHFGSKTPENDLLTLFTGLPSSP